MSSQSQPFTLPLLTHEVPQVSQRTRLPEAIPMVLPSLTFSSASLRWMETRWRVKSCLRLNERPQVLW